MPELALEFEVYCSCGNGLCNQSSEGKTVHRGMPFITVAPCEKCQTSEYDRGHSDGYDEGVNDA